MERVEIARLIGNRIKEERRRQKLSQETLAFESNIHPSYFGCIERGEKCPTVDTLYKISTALNVPINRLMEFESCEIDPEPTPCKKIENALMQVSAEKQEQVAEMVVGIIKLIK